MRYKSVQAIRGMNDILPPQTSYWQRLESTLRDVVSAYGYQEIRLPLLEKTELFTRSIGEVTDIVEKEMYTFDDRNGESLTLRPEGTAGCVRAAIEHSLLYHQEQRLWYMGPMFRYERPQKGRYRQFHHFGVEAFGFPGPDIDIEMLLMTARFWEQLGIQKRVTLHLNSLGTPTVRAAYRERLVHYFSQHVEHLDEDSKRRLHTNPLRILDSKNPELQDVIERAPKLLDYLDAESDAHFSAVRRLLDAAQIDYRIDRRLVRGLDYYNKTVFEWITASLGSQGTVCAGGRYDGLVELLGGGNVPGIGFAMGLERLAALLETTQSEVSQNTADIYLVMVGDPAVQQGFLLAEQLRSVYPHLRVMNHCGGGHFKNQFKRADKSGASLALVLGEDEVHKQSVVIKYLREKKPQQTVPLNKILAFVGDYLRECGSKIQHGVI